VIGLDLRAAFEKNFAAVRKQIEAACARSSRRPEEIRIIGVTKTVTPDAIPQWLDIGLREFGENRWQHARDMLTAPGADGAIWHFIGHLQTNKVKYIVRHFEWIHSVDSVDLANEISACAVKNGVTMNCLVQVNVSGEATKHGVPPAEVEPLVETMLQLPGIRLRGLMTMAPLTDDVERIRAVFRGLRELRDQVRATFGLTDFTELSMGMSEDFPIAIEEGATMVRLGRVLMSAE
jgi:pyridoxal phosphate enzyme (YggS family)